MGVLFSFLMLFRAIRLEFKLDQRPPAPTFHLWYINTVHAYIINPFLGTFLVSARPQNNNRRPQAAKPQVSNRRSANTRNTNSKRPTNKKVRSTHIPISWLITNRVLISDCPMNFYEKNSPLIPCRPINFQAAAAAQNSASANGRCPGGDLEMCIDVCPSFSARIFGACVSGCAKRCPSKK